MKVGHEEEFKSLFNPIVFDIQNHGRYSLRNYIPDNINDAYVERHSRTFLRSDLFREQMRGLDDMLDKSQSGHFAYFTQNDFSQTGAARTMELDAHNFLADIILKGSFTNKRIVNR